MPLPMPLLTPLPALNCFGLVLRVLGQLRCWFASGQRGGHFCGHPMQCLCHHAVAIDRSEPALHDDFFLAQGLEVALFNGVR